MRARFLVTLALMFPSFSASSEERDFKLIRTQKTSFDRSFSATWLSDVKVKDIDALSDGVLLEIPVLNNSPYSLMVKNLETSCACTKAELPGGEWKPGETKLLKARVTTLSNQRREILKSSIVGTAKTSDSRNPEVQLVFRVTCELANVLRFSDTVYPFRYNESDFREFEIPLVCTIAKPNLSLEASPPIKDLDFSLEQREGKSLVKVLVDADSLPGDGVMGTIRIMHATADKEIVQEDSTTLLFEKIVPVSLSPRTVRLRPGTDGKFSGTAIIRFEKDVVVDEEASKPFVEILIDDWSCKVDVQELSPTVFRLGINAHSKSQDAPEHGKTANYPAVWQIIYAKSRFQIASKLQVVFP